MKSYSVTELPGDPGNPIDSMVEIIQGLKAAGDPRMPVIVNRFPARDGLLLLMPEQAEKLLTSHPELRNADVAIVREEMVAAIGITLPTEAEEERLLDLHKQREDAARRLESLQSHIDAALEAEGG